MRLLQMSLSAGLLIAVIIFLRRVGRRLFSARFLFVLWFAAVARMLLPFYIPVQLPGISMETVQPGQGQEEVVMTAFAKDHLQGTAGTDRAGLYARYARVLFLIWADGALLLLILFTCIFIRQSSRFRESVPLRGNPCLEEWKASHPMKRDVGFMYSDRTSSPVTFGIWHPKILFPRDMEFGDRVSVGHILNHEYVHIRRFDNLWKLVVLAAVCVHWFNPLAWVMWHYFNRDMELACDESAVAGMDGNGRLAYAMTLLRFAEKNRKVSLLCNGFGKSPVRERIMILMKSGRRKILGIVCSILVTAFSMTAFAAVKDSSTSAGTYGTEGKSPARILSETPQFKEYEALGLYYDPALDIVYYNSSGVGYLLDEYSGETYNRMNDLAGSLCIKAERDHEGKLTGFAEVEMTDYLKQASAADQRMAQGRGYIREYGPYGISYDQETGYLSYNGKLVEAIKDTGGCGIYVNGSAASEANTTCLQIERDENGAVREVKELTPEQMSEVLHQTMGVYRSGNSWKGDGE